MQGNVYSFNDELILILIQDILRDFYVFGFGV